MTEEYDFVIDEGGGERDEKEERLSARIDDILSIFSLQFAKNYARMRVSSAISSIVDKEMNREAYSSIARYYHIAENVNGMDTSFEPVYGLRIASSRTEIGRDRNEYTAYVIVGSCMTPYGSKLTVCVKRFVELRAFAQELENYLEKRNQIRNRDRSGTVIIHNDGNSSSKNNNINSSNNVKKASFPFHYRLFGLINEQKLKERKDWLNNYFKTICDNAIVVGSHLFLTFFHFTTKKHDYEISKEVCIEETLQAMKEASQNDDRENMEAQLISMETPIDLHHYNDGQYKLIASVFDTIYREMAIEENQEQTRSSRRGAIGVQSGSANVSPAKKGSIDINTQGGGSHGNNINNSNNTMTRSRATSSGHARTPSIMRPYLHHVRSGSIIASTFSPAVSLVDFKENLSYISEEASMDHRGRGRGKGKGKGGGKGKGKRNTTGTGDGANYMYGGAGRAWGGGGRGRGRADTDTQWSDSNQEHFKDYSNRGRSKVLTEDRGPRIIRLAAEATSEESLSYKIPTKIHDMWEESNEIINKKMDKKLNRLIDSCKNELYPLIQECIHDVIPIAKDLIESSKAKKDSSEKERSGGSGRNKNNDNDSQSSDSDVDGSTMTIGLNNFAMIKAMKQYCLIEERLFEYLIAFCNLSIEKPYLSRKGTFIDMLNYKYDLLLSSKSNLSNYNVGSRKSGNSSENDDRPLSPDNYGMSPHSNVMNEEFMDRIRQIERIHKMISSNLIDIVYHLFKTLIEQCFSLIVAYKDELEEMFEKDNLPNSNRIMSEMHEMHEDRLLSILRNCGYNLSLVCDELKQKILQRFHDYSSKIFFPILDGIVTLCKLSANCLSLIISNFSFDENLHSISSVKEFRQHFVECWEQSVDYYLSDVTECVMNTLYRSCVGLVCSASQDLLKESILTMSSSAHSHSSSQWFQILKVKKYRMDKIEAIFSRITKYITIKDVLNIAISRTLINVVEERLIFLRLDAQKRFFYRLLSSSFS